MGRLRLYPTNEPPTYTPPTIRGAWDQTSGSPVTRRFGTLPGGSNTSKGTAETSATNNFDVLLGRWISEPITVAQTITGSVDILMAVLESNLAANDVLHIHMFVTTGDTDVVRGTILTDYIDGTEFFTTTADFVETGFQALTNVAASVGDRIVMEVGYQAQNTSITSRTGTVRYGGTADDGYTGGADATVQIGWVEFDSNDNLFADTSTRFYMNNGPTPYTPATKRGAWDDATAASITALNRGFDFGTATLTATETSTTNNFDVLMGRFVSPGAIRAGTISGNVRWLLGLVESSASANSFIHVHIYVTSGDSDTPRGTILTDSIGTTELDTTATFRTTGKKALSSLAIQAGDRIVIEVGVQNQNTSATSFTSTLNIGANTDVAGHEGNTDTVDKPGYFEFDGLNDLFFDYADQFRDGFNDNSVDTNIWTQENFSNVIGSEVNQNYEFAITFGTTQYAFLYRKQWCNLYGKRTSIQLKDAGNQALATLECIFQIQCAGLHGLDGTSEGYRWVIHNNLITVQYIFNGFYTTLSEAAYSSSTMQYFSIREASAGGALVFEYSDGNSNAWTELVRMANPLPLGAVSIIASAGTYAIEASNTTPKFDNFNSFPSMLLPPRSRRNTLLRT